MTNIDSVKRMLRTRGALVAGITAVSLAALLVIQSVLLALITWLHLLSVPNFDLSQYSPFSGLLEETALTVLPFVAGFFLSLWLVGPISEELRLPHVITRSVLGAGIGATLVFVVHSVVWAVQGLRFSGSFFGNSFPTPTIAGPSIPDVLGQALATSLSDLVSLVPLAVLAGILLWHWRKAHPATFHVEGLIDV